MDFGVNSGTVGEQCRIKSRLTGFALPLSTFADCPLSRIHDSVMHIVRLNVWIHADNLDAYCRWVVHFVDESHPRFTSAGQSIGKLQSHAVTQEMLATLRKC